MLEAVRTVLLDHALRRRRIVRGLLLGLGGACTGGVLFVPVLKWEVKLAMFMIGTMITTVAGTIGIGDPNMPEAQPVAQPQVDAALIATNTRGVKVTRPGGGVES